MNFILVVITLSLVVITSSLYRLFSIYKCYSKEKNIYTTISLCMLEHPAKCNKNLQKKIYTRRFADSHCINICNNDSCANSVDTCDDCIYAKKAYVVVDKEDNLDVKKD